MSKISFKNESKHIPGFPLNKIETFGKFQDLNEENQLKQRKSDLIDFYYNQLNDIIYNKKGSTMKKQASRTIKEPEITSIYLLIEDKTTKGKLLKNEMIDRIEHYYRTQYVPRHARSSSNIVINIAESNKNQDKNIFDVTQNNDDDSSEDDADFDI